MKLIILESDCEDKVHLHALSEETPVFVKLKGRLVGLVIEDEEGWILKLGGVRGSHGHSPTRKICLEKGLKHGYTYFIEDDGGDQ